MFVHEQPEKLDRKKDKLMRSCLACFAKKQLVSYPIPAQSFIRQAARGPLRGLLLLSRNKFYVRLDWSLRLFLG